VERSSDEVRQLVHPSGGESHVTDVSALHQRHGGGAEYDVETDERSHASEPRLEVDQFSRVWSIVDASLLHEQIVLTVARHLQP